jgi:hypothetical protein
MALDNFGGFAHPGRRLDLMMDGRFLETSYTDVIGDAHISSSGTYAIHDLKTFLHLYHAAGSIEKLARIEHEGVEFWVAEEKRERLQLPSEKWLRQISLRRVAQSNP